MSSTVKEIVLKSIKTALHNTISVDGETISYFTDYFGNKQNGIYLNIYQGDEDGCKTSFSQNVRIELVIFGKGKTVDFVAEITRKVMQALKASVDATLTLNDGYKATYTKLPKVLSYTELESGVTVHRDILSVDIRVDEDQTQFNNS